MSENDSDLKEMVANDLDIVLIDVTFYLQHVQKLVVKLLIKIYIIWDGRLKGHSVSQKVSVNCFWVCHIINYRPIYLSQPINESPVSHHQASV